MHVLPALQHGAAGSDYTGFGQAAAGLVLLGLGRVGGAPAGAGGGAAGLTAGIEEAGSDRPAIKRDAFGSYSDHKPSGLTKPDAFSRYTRYKRPTRSPGGSPSLPYASRR